MNWILLMGRVLFGGFFLLSGFNHFTNVRGMSAYAAAHAVPLPELAVVVTGLMLVLGGLSLVLGLAPRIGLSLLVLFLVPVALVMHAFWNLPAGEPRMLQLGFFLRNFALSGAALGLMAMPVPWPISVDEALRRKWPSWDRWTTFHRPAHP